MLSFLMTRSGVAARRRGLRVEPADRAVGTAVDHVDYRLADGQERDLRNLFGDHGGPAVLRILGARAGIRRQHIMRDGLRTFLGRAVTPAVDQPPLVALQSSLEPLRGKSARLRFILRDGSLYAFQFADGKS